MSYPAFRARREELRRLVPLMILGAALVCVPIIGSDFLAYQIALYLIYGVACQGVAICWGQLSFIPLGHALFFGLGAYLFGGLLKAAALNPLWYVATPIAVLAPAALAWVIARLLFARSVGSGPYFSLITLAITMLGYLAAQQWVDVTGGFNGMIEIPELPGFDRYGNLYWLVALMALASTLFLSVLIRRPIGLLWSAVAQNEDRMQLFGYATDRIKSKAYALSALLAALAGALFAAHQGIVTPQSMSYVLATEFVIWTAVGGKSSPMGALLGAVLVGYSSALLRDNFAMWEVGVGLLFIAVVLFLPHGLAGLVSDASKRSSAAGRALPSPAPESHTPRVVPALTFDSVCSTVGSVCILNGLSFELQGQGIRAVIGPNGAGKTSAFNAITGWLRINSGFITLASRDITGMAAWRVARMGLGRKLQVPSVFSELTVAQNLSIAVWAGRLGSLQSLSASPEGWQTDLQREMLDAFPELRAHFDVRAGDLSQGQRQALEFVMTILPEPHLLLLDEPCAGLSPAETQRMIAAIQHAVRRLRAGALLIEHDLAAVKALQGEVLVLHQGKLLAKGALAAVQSDPEVRAVYAGAAK